MKVFMFFVGVCVLQAQLSQFHPAQKSGVVVGRLVIPSIGLDQIIREGVHMSVIDQGVAHWAGTPELGQLGNVVLAGHRTVKTKPFFHLKKLQVRDLIQVVNERGEVSNYQVYETFSIHPARGRAIINASPVPESIITIFTCHPLYSQAERFVVRARLVEDSQ